MSATQSAPEQAIVLLVDVVGSSELKDFAAGRDRAMARLTKLHGRDGWIGADYAVTAWDEFQSVVVQWQHLGRVLLDIRRVLAPWQVYIGIGIGPVTGWGSGQPVNRALSGEGFNRAREAMDALKSGRGDKYSRLTRFRSGDKADDALLELIYGLHDSLVEQVTARQWQTINAVMDGKATQEDVAEQLDVQPSTVTRNLRRGHYWQMQETVRVMTELMARLARERAIL